MKRPALGTILGATACVIALSGTGVAADAASLITGKQVKDHSLTGKDIKNASITSANLAPDAVTSEPQGPKGDKGDKGDIGPAGTAVAYAYVHADGTLDASRTKGVGWATKVTGTAGEYCLGGLAQAPRNVSLTLTSPQQTAYVGYVTLTPGFCDATTQIAVHTGNDSGFMVAIN